MANRGSFPIVGVKSDLHLITAKLTGAGAANMVNAESSNMGGGEVVSAVRSDTGDFTLTFRHSYPELKSIVGLEFLGTTAGLQARFITCDVAAKTATITCEVAGTATDPASGDTLFINLLVRNSGRNT